MTDNTKAEEESRRRFAERLGDWSEPGAITIIRNGVPIEDTLAGVVEPISTTPTVVGTDADGNIRMSDGTIIVTKE